MVFLIAMHTNVLARHTESSQQQQISLENYHQSTNSLRSYLGVFSWYYFERLLNRSFSCSPAKPSHQLTSVQIIDATIPRGRSIGDSALFPANKSGLENLHSDRRCFLRYPHKMRLHYIRTHLEPQIIVTPGEWRRLSVMNGSSVRNVFPRSFWRWVRVTLIGIAWVTWRYCRDDLQYAGDSVRCFGNALGSGLLLSRCAESGYRDAINMSRADYCRRLVIGEIA